MYILGPVSMTDWNTKTALEWGLGENLVGFSARTIDITKWVHVSNSETEGDRGIDNASVYSSGGAGFPGSDLGHCSSSKSFVSVSADSSSKEGVKTGGSANHFPKDFGEKKDVARVDSAENIPSLSVSASCGEPLIGLKLGQRTYFEDVCAASSAKTSSVSMITSCSATTTRRSRTSFKSTLTPRCQVEGCNLDLKSAKDYHRRHGICETHSKSPKVIVAGMERRFCQQCSRFHELSEFDGKKRSCRRRLSDHNARRRRLQPGAIQFDSARLSSSFYGDGRQQMNLQFNGMQFPAANPTWPNSCNFNVTQVGDSLVRPAKTGGMDMQLNLPTSEMPDATPTLEVDSNKNLSFESGTPQTFSQGLEASAITSTFEVTPDMRRALSLLSTTSWGLNEPEPTSLDQLFHASQTIVRPVMHPELPNFSQSDHEQVARAPTESRVQSLNLQNNGNIHFQEFQLFKEPYESDCFYSSHIN